MKRMADVIKKQRLDIYNHIEEQPHDAIQVTENLSLIPTRLHLFHSFYMELLTSNWNRWTLFPIWKL